MNRAQARREACARAAGAIENALSSAADWLGGYSEADQIKIEAELRLIIERLDDRSVKR